MEDEWFENGELHLVGGLEKLDADQGECAECAMILIDGEYVHEAECPHAFEEEDDAAGFFDDEDEQNDFEDVEDIDLLIDDQEAEALINKEEDIPDEDLRDTVFEERDDFEAESEDGEEEGANLAASEEG